MKAIQIPALGETQRSELENLYRTTKQPRYRTRAQMVLPAAEQGLSAPALVEAGRLWRQFRREVTHCELFETVAALLTAAQDFFDRYKLIPTTVLSIIGSHAATLL